MWSQGLTCAHKGVKLGLWTQEGGHITDKQRGEAMRKIEFKWTKSNGRETSGYPICSLLVDGVKFGHVMGGGYDMKGAVLSNWMMIEFKQELEAMAKPELDRMNKSNSIDNQYERNAETAGFYGFITYRIKQEKKADWYLDGSCGFNSMENILNELGYVLEYSKNSETRNKTGYFLSKKGE